MSEPGDDRNHREHDHHDHDHHHRRGSKNEKKVIHHNHYKHGSVVSSYTAVAGQSRMPEHHAHQPGTTPFRPCTPKDKKRIEIVVKQEGGLGYTVAHDQVQVQQPVQQGVPPPAATCAPAPPLQSLQYHYIQPQYTQMEPIYEPAPPARRYEVYRAPEVTERRKVSFDEGTQMSKTFVETGPVQNRKQTSLGAGPSQVTFEVTGRKNQEMTEKGTGKSMILNPTTPMTSNNPQKLVIIKREGHHEMDYDSKHGREPMAGNDKGHQPMGLKSSALTRILCTGYPATPAVLSEINASMSRVEMRERGLCPLCHKGFYVKKFTWSGIIAAIFCFPCGIYACFKMRVDVCSFCGEEPVAEYKNYKERDAQKTEGNENSRSRIIPPQKPSNWVNQRERDSGEDQNMTSGEDSKEGSKNKNRKMSSDAEDDPKERSKNRKMSSDPDEGDPKERSKNRKTSSDADEDDPKGKSKKSR